MEGGPSAASTQRIGPPHRGHVSRSARKTERAATPSACARPGRDACTAWSSRASARRSSAYGRCLRSVLALGARAPARTLHRGDSGTAADGLAYGLVRGGELGGCGHPLIVPPVLFRHSYVRSDRARCSSGVEGGNPPPLRHSHVCRFAQPPRVTTSTAKQTIDRFIGSSYLRGARQPTDRIVYFMQTNT